MGMVLASRIENMYRSRITLSVITFILIIFSNFLSSKPLINLIYNFNWILLEPWSWVFHNQLPTSTQLLTALLTIIRISPQSSIFPLRPFLRATAVRILVSDLHRVPVHPLLWRPMLIVSRSYLVRVFFYVGLLATGTILIIKFVFIFTVYQS